MGKHWSEYEQPDNPGPRYFIETGDDDTWQDRRSNTWGLQWSLLQRFARTSCWSASSTTGRTWQYLTITNPWDYDPSGLGAAHDLWNVHPGWAACTCATSSSSRASPRTSGCAWTTGSSAARSRTPSPTPATRTSAPTPGASSTRTPSRSSGAATRPSSPAHHGGVPDQREQRLLLQLRPVRPEPVLPLRLLQADLGLERGVPDPRQPQPQPAGVGELRGRRTPPLHPTVGLNASVFVKDIYDYPVATTFKRQSGTDLSDVLVYLNGHYARSKGFEVEVEKAAQAAGGPASSRTRSRRPKARAATPTRPRSSRRTAATPARRACPSPSCAGTGRTS